MEDFIPPQPKGERAKFITIWVVLAILGTAVCFATLPYDFTKQSPILAKNDVYRSIENVRSHKGGHWPKDERDPEVKYGKLALNEKPVPTFQYQDSKFESGIEFGIYKMNFRGSEMELKVAFDPKRKPKKSRF